MTMAIAGTNILLLHLALRFLQSVDVVLHWTGHKKIDYLVKDERHHKTEMLVAQ